jgi:hypothetical protein
LLEEMLEEETLVDGFAQRHEALRLRLKLDEHIDGDRGVAKPHMPAYVAVAAREVLAA